MCGRAYSTYTDQELHDRYLNHLPVRIPRLEPNYNLSPTQLAPVLRRAPDGKAELCLLRWGLVPSWARDIKIGYSLINARSETVREKPSFRSAIKSRRCVLPLSGFIEWKREGEKKRPFRIFLAGNPIMSVAGIWEEWRSPVGELLETFSILTTSANRFMSPIHDRMPVILSPVGEARWLDRGNRTGEGFDDLFAPSPDEWLSACEISTAINSPRNNRKELLEPLAHEAVVR
jgi:putative SOS response-associated peptidase YedK